jgi:fibronectin type 3 domain-containing protein
MMKTMRDIFLTGVLVAMLATCDMLQEPEAEKAVGEGKVLVSVQVDQGYSGAERSVFPQVGNNIVYALWGAPVESEEAETALIPSFTMQDNPSPSVELTAGFWNFTVKGYKAEDLVLQGELKNQTISLGSHSLSFSVEPLLESTGSISITITLPVDSGITTVLVFKDGDELESLTLSPTDVQVTYSEADVVAGDYYYTFRLNNNAGNTLVVVSQIVQVRARLSSEKTIVLTKLNTPPVALSAAPLVESRDGQLRVSWEPVEMAGDYEVYWSDDSTPPDAPDAPAKTVSNMTSTTISDLTNGTMYYVWVKVQNAAGSSDFSPMASGTPMPPPFAPAQPTVTIGNSQLMVSWNTVSWADAYEVYYSTSTSNGAPGISSENVVIDGVSAVISGLINGTTYYVWVKAKNAVGTSGFSPSASGTPLAVPNPTVTIGDGQLTLTWPAVLGAESYKVYYSETETEPSPETTTPSNVTITGSSALITGLTNGGTYYMWVQAQNAGGLSPLSEGVSGIPLAPPAHVVAVSLSPNSIQVSWDDAGEGISYKVYRLDSSGGLYTLISTRETLSYTDSGLSPGTLYYYKVSSLKDSNESAQSAAVSAKTQSQAFITVTVSDQNDVDMTAQSVTLSRGQDGTFQVSSGSYETYQWYLDGAAIAEAKSSSYTLHTTSMTLGMHELSVLVSTAAGVKLSGNCYVTVIQQE